MQVLLNKDVAKLGYRGDLVNVKNGYFRNFLFPRGLAQIATDALLKLHKDRKEKALIEKKRILENAQSVLDKLSGLVLHLTEKASAKGKLYASVTELEILEAIVKKAGVKLDREMLKLESHIKDLGEHNVKIVLGQGVETEVKVVVVAE